MGGKLSALKFVLNNKKQAWVMTAALSLTFMTMYVINFLFLATEESYKAIFLDQPGKVAFLDLSAETVGADRDKLIAEIESQEGIDGAVFTQVLQVNYQGIVGNVGYDFPLLSKEQIPGYIEHMGAKLLEGRLPEGDGEILVDQRVLKNQKLKVGGYFNELSYGKTFRVVGVLESDDMICVGTPQGYTNTGWYIVVLCDSEHSDMAELLAKIGVTPTVNDRLLDSAEMGDMYEELVTTQLDAALLGILIVAIVFLAASILPAYVSFMRSRVNEYCLYASIGFGRSDVYGMMMRELLLIFGGGILLGAAVTLVILFLFARFLLEPLGLLYQYFYPEHLLRILAAFVAIVGILQIPVTIIIHKIKTIDLIEE